MKDPLSAQYVNTNRSTLDFIPFFFCAPNGEATDRAFKLHSARDFPPGAEAGVWLGVCVRMVLVPQYGVF